MHAGDRFGNYLLLERIAHGGMAEIFVAEKIGAMDFRRKVCIKRILSSFHNDQAFVKMFIDEARTTSQLRHSNIVAIDDFGDTDGHLWACMEWVHGVDAAKLFKELNKRGRRMPVDVALFVAVEVLKALEYAHAKRDDQGRWLEIVHRDVSPQNVMISYVGEVKLTDFGIARATSRLYQTQGDLVKGKLSYMAPEQANGKSLDGRTDLFALGIVLYEFLAGERPFWRPHRAEEVVAMVHGRRQPLRARRPEVPVEIEAFVDRLLAQRPEDRFRDATEALDDAQGIPALVTGMRSLRLLMNELYNDAASVVVPRFGAPEDTQPAQPPLPEATDAFSPESLGASPAGGGSSTVPRPIPVAKAPGAAALKGAPTITRPVEPVLASAPPAPVSPPPAQANASAPYAVVPAPAPPGPRVWVFALVAGAAVAILGVLGYAVVVRPPTANGTAMLPAAAARDAGGPALARTSAAVVPSDAGASPAPASPVAQALAVAPTTAVSQEAPARERLATLAWVAQPWADVTVHDETYASSSRQSVQLPAGSYRLVARHPTYGTITRRVRLRAGERKSVTLVFGAQAQGDEGQ